MAKVLVQTKSACDGCNAGGACTSTQEGMEIEALNSVHAEVGQKVKVLMAPRQYLKGSMLVYGVPLVAFIAGAIFGKHIGDEYFTEMNSELVAALSGFAALMLSLIIVKIGSRKIESNTEYQPVIEKIVD